MTVDDETEQQKVDGAAEARPTVDAASADESSGTATTSGETAATAAPELRRLSRVKLLAATLVSLLLISGGLAGWLYFSQYRPDEQTDSSAAAAAVAAARDGTVAMLSYSPDSLDRDFATAKSHLTGDFLTYYDQFTQQIVTPAAKEKALRTTAQVMGAAASELRPDSAVVLVFVNQSTTSKDKPDPAMAASTVRVSLTKVDGTWLITKFDPV